MLWVTCICEYLHKDSKLKVSSNRGGFEYFFRNLTHHPHLDGQLGQSGRDTAYPIWGDIFECCLKAQSSKLERLFCHVSQSSKLKARTSLLPRFTWQKRRSSFELWAFENVTPSAIGCTYHNSTKLACSHPLILMNEIFVNWYFKLNENLNLNLDRLFLCFGRVLTFWTNLSERTPHPRGGFLFTIFPHHQPFVRGTPSKNLEVLWVNIQKQIGNPSAGGGVDLFRSNWSSSNTPTCCLNKKCVPDTSACRKFPKSYSWARRGSNTGPLDLQSNALPTAPQTPSGHFYSCWNTAFYSMFLEIVGHPTCPHS